MTRIAVIGAGVGGLAGAALLSARGHQVDIYEQSSHVGGKLGQQNLAGVRFDTGPSLLTLPDVLRGIFDKTGGWPESLSLQRLSPIAHMRFADGTGFHLHDDVDRFCDELERWSPSSGNDWKHFHSRAEQIWNATHKTFLERELRGVRSLAGLAVRHPRDLLRISPGRTLDQLCRKYLHDPRLRQFVWRYATYTGSDPRRAPAALATIPYAEHHFGGWYVRGGLHQIATALAVRCIDLGARIHVSSPVVGIEIESGRARGIRLADRTVDADVVIANADASRVYAQLTPDSATAGARRRLERAPRSYSGFALLAGVHGPRPAGLAHHTVFFPPDSTAEFNQLRAGEPVRDPTIYVSAPDDSSVASGEIRPLFVLVNAPRQDQYDWNAHGAEHPYAAGILGLLAHRGLDIRSRLTQLEIRTPADLEAATWTPGGAIYGTSSDGMRAAFLRPANRSPVPGLYLVGGSAHPGGGIPLALLSADIVSELIGPADEH